MENPMEIPYDLRSPVPRWIHGENWASDHCQVDDARTKKASFLVMVEREGGYKHWYLSID